MIDSYETEKFEVGKEYWTYFYDISKKGNKLLNYTGLMRVKLDSKDPTQYTPKGYKKFTILETTKKLGDVISHNIHTYMEGYGSARCKFFENKDDCIKYHDKELVKESKGLNTHDRDVILNKLIGKTTVQKEKIELDSVKWYNSLSTTEKDYVKWIKNYYEEI